MSFRAHLRVIEDLRGPAGQLEAVQFTGLPDAPFAALVAHPHPLGGGTMHNKVVYHAAKAFSAYGLPVLRFNFRSVGLSEGAHDGGPGEIADVTAAIDWLEREFGLPILFAGFSFGANVGIRACCGDKRIKGIVGLGIPIEAEGRHYSYGFLSECRGVPKIFLSGDHDPYGPADLVNQALALAPQPKQVVWIKGADHFFAGTPQSPDSKLGVMSGALRAWLASTFGLKLQE